MADPLNGFAERAANHFARTGRPLVTLTYAQSLDGSIAARRDRRLELSGDESRAMTHRLRAAHAAILVGIGTLLADDPRLSARLAGGPDPQPVILDSHLRFPLDARLLQNPLLKPWIFTSAAASPERRAELEQVGAHLVTIPAAAGGLLDLSAMIAILGERGLSSLMVEGGARVITRFLAERLPDWLVITIAPLFVGGQPAVEPSADGSMSFPRLENVCSTQLGRDVIVWGDLKSEGR
jgi:GTP cyclohydrolase II